MGVVTQKMPVADGRGATQVDLLEIFKVSVQKTAKMSKKRYECLDMGHIYASYSQLGLIRQHRLDIRWINLLENIC